MDGRRLVALTVLLGGASVVLAQDETRAKALIAKARAALGGEARLSSIKTFVMKGAISGPRMSDGHFTIHGRLPDAFVRYRRVADNGARSERSTSRLGFVGPHLIYEPNVRSYEVQDVAPATDVEIRELDLQARRELLPVVLGLFATSAGVAPDIKEFQIDVPIPEPVFRPVATYKKKVGGRQFVH